MTMASRVQTTKASFPRACAAIFEGRYRVVFVDAGASSGHKSFVVLRSQTARVAGRRTDASRPTRFVGATARVVHETNGAGKALTWVEEQERAARQV